jgi:hypothetical protein
VIVADSDHDTIEPGVNSFPPSSYRLFPVDAPHAPGSIGLGKETDMKEDDDIVHIAAEVVRKSMADRMTSDRRERVAKFREDLLRSPDETAYVIELAAREAASVIMETVAPHDVEQVALVLQTFMIFLSALDSAMGYALLAQHVSAIGQVAASVLEDRIADRGTSQT